MNILTSMEEKHAKFIDEDKPTIKFISALNGMISCGLVTLEQIGIAYNTDKHSKIVVGYYDEKYYYLIPSVTYNQICSFYSKQNENFSTSRHALLKQLAEEKFIKTSGGRNTIGHRINNKQSRYIWFYKDKFDNFESESHK